MADLTITATSVVPVSGYSAATGVAGVAITAGQTVYIDTSDSNKIKLADCDSATSDVRACVGVALHAAAAGQPIRYITSGSFNPGATVVVGETYMVSDTAGGIMPVADLETGDYVSYLAYASTASNLVMMLNNTGIVHA